MSSRKCGRSHKISALKYVWMCSRINYSTHVSYTNKTTCVVPVMTLPGVYDFRIGRITAGMSSAVRTPRGRIHAHTLQSLRTRITLCVLMLNERVRATERIKHICTYFDNELINSRVIVIEIYAVRFFRPKQQCDNCRLDVNVCTHGQVIIPGGFE